MIPMPWLDKEKRNADNLARYHRQRDVEMVRRRLRSLEKRALLAGRYPGTCCDICHKFHWKPAHWDHDHKTGVFRGWLCETCNKALGLLRDNPVTADAAAVYLRSFSCSL